MIDKADVVVIGSGALGASTAFHVAKMGRHVALVDKAALASQTSPRAAGLSGQLRKSELMTRLAVMAVQKIERFEADTDQPLVFHQPGSLKIARLPEHVEQLREEVARGQRLGLDIDFIAPEEARRLVPFLETKGVRAVTHMRTDVYLEPVQVPLGYVRASAQLGAALLPDTRVTEIVTESASVSRVVTDKGEIRTGVVVDAAGAWLRLVAELGQARVPVVPTRHQLMITEALAGVRPEQPITRIIDANVYVRPEKGGLMLGGYEANPVQHDPRRLAPDFKIEDLELDLSVLRRLAESVYEQLPVFRDIKVREHRGGLPTMTTDGEHVVGPVPGVQGLYVVGGCCVGGLSIAPALGELLAEWIVVGKPRLDLAGLSPARFSADVSEAALSELCRKRYAYSYWSPQSMALRG
jgi:glycine/D-amino acid oxidase-like deaminating enzyme